MFSAYLVDDEPLILSDMLRSVPWAENDFKVVGTQSDPALAREEILSLAPDVVFTDMKMPRMTGLELVAALKADGCAAEFVVISAYDSFEYVRQMIVLEGFDYLIKPVDEAQYTELFTRLRKKLSGKRGRERRPATNSPELNQIIAYLKEHFARKQSLLQIAQQFSINPQYICRLFSKYMDTTFSTYLAKLRMEHAAHLLRTTEKSIKEIAVLSGYDDYFYFCRVFREAYGCTPTQYRGAP